MTTEQIGKNDAVELSRVTPDEAAPKPTHDMRMCINLCAAALSIGKTWEQVATLLKMEIQATNEMFGMDGDTAIDLHAVVVHVRMAMYMIERADK